MTQKCVLDFESSCNSCGECKLCDLDKEVECINCMKCVLDDKESRFMTIDEIKNDPKKKDDI
ncbi:hypothetical protein [Natranaerobius trueperi]|uniref:Uncharacterized protein n=1 Tax=Natranaerobius trueperi TaxID=759412 RepID=A0A226C2N9_9FIRM|nr:hypothetical protein [Natranaerobius trueperi]OWZ84894.1 hypothetical protein CDO51_00360 [Natranaerobius trueperi]